MNDIASAVVLKLGLLSEDDLARTFAEFCSLALLSGDAWPKEPVDAIDLNPAFLRAHELMPIAVDTEQLKVACWDGLDDYAVRALRFASGRSVVHYIATRTIITSALDTCIQ